MRLTWLAALTGGLGSLLALHPAVWEGASRLPGPECPASLPPVIALAASGLFRHGLCRPAMVDQSNPDQTVMSFYDLPYLDGVVCSGRAAQVFPDTAAGTVSGRASYQFHNTSGPGTDRWHLA